MALTMKDLEDMIKKQMEEAGLEITNKLMDNIHTEVAKQFDEIAKGYVRKPIGGDSTDIDPDTQFKSFGEQLQSVYVASKMGKVDKRLKWEGIVEKEPMGANEGIPSEGGFLVQTDFSTELIKNVHTTANLFAKCRKIPISANSNSLTINGVDETSRANGSRWGGVQVYFSDEAGTVTATKPKFRQMNLKLKKLMGLYYATDEVLQDAAALGAIVTQAFQEEYAFKLDDQILNGTGAGQLLGILNSAALISQAAEAGQIASTVVYENIINMWNRMPAYNRTKAEWYINQDVEPQLDQMYLAIGAGGIPVYWPAGGVTASAPATIKARPVNVVEQCQALGTLGDIMLLDLSQYLVIDKGAMQSAESIHVRFINDEDTFRFTYRVDGQPLWSTTLTSFNSGTTRSPFVGLASR